MNRFTEQNKALAKLTDNALPGSKTPAQEDAKAPTTDSGRPGRHAQKERTSANAAPSCAVEDSCAVDSLADAFRGRWPHHIAAAKTKWGKLSDTDLQAVGGSESKLADLVRQRYALDEEVAYKQVRHFIERCNR